MTDRLDEKATSVAQQRAMGAALEAKRTGKPTFGLAAKLASSLTEKQLKDFAGTKHKGLPGHAPKRQGKDESTMPDVQRQDGSYKSFSEWLAEATDFGDEQEGGEIDASSYDHDEAVVFVLQELGLVTKSEIDPEADKDTIDAAMEVKLALVKDKIKSSGRLQDLARENPEVQRVLGDSNATVSDLIFAVSSDDNLPPGGDDEHMDSFDQQGEDEIDDDPDPFTPF